MMACGGSSCELPSLDALKFIFRDRYGVGERASRSWRDCAGEPLVFHGVAVFVNRFEQYLGPIDVAVIDHLDAQAHPDVAAVSLEFLGGDACDGNSPCRTPARRCN